MGSLVITYETAKRIGWVKEVRRNPDNGDETVVIAPVPVAWLPKSMTGACELSSSAVVGSGDGCLIVTEQADMRLTLQSNSAKKLIDGAMQAWRITLVLFLFLLLLPFGLLLLPLALLFLAIFIIAKFSRKKLWVYPIRPWDDDGNAGFSPVRQPRPPGPQPTDSIELELPLVDSERDIASSPVIRLQ